MGTAYKYDPSMCDIAIKTLAGGESLAAVCCELDITRSTLYEWRDTYPDFKAALEKGLNAAQREWESIGQDATVGNIKNFQNPVWVFTMKNRFREDYADKQEHKSIGDTLVEKLIDKLVD